MSARGGARERDPDVNILNRLDFPNLALGLQRTARDAIKWRTRID